MKKVYALQIFISWFFISSACLKSIVISSVAREIDAYQIIPSRYVFEAALALIAVEFALGIWLLINKKVNIAASLSVGLLAVFMLAKLSAVMRGIEIRCNVCFGTFLSMPLWANVVLNVSLIAILMYILYHRTSNDCKHLSIKEIS